jgi:hypothetical protein
MNNVLPMLDYRKECDRKDRIIQDQRSIILKLEELLIKEREGSSVN